MNVCVAWARLAAAAQGRGHNEPVHNLLLYRAAFCEQPDGNVILALFFSWLCSHEQGFYLPMNEKIASTFRFGKAFPYLLSVWHLSSLSTCLALAKSEMKSTRDIRTSETFNMVKYALNTQDAYNTVLSNFVSADFWPKMDPTRPKITRNAPFFFPIYNVLLIYYIIALEAHWKTVVGVGIA